MSLPQDYINMQLLQRLLLIRLSTYFSRLAYISERHGATETNSCKNLVSCYILSHQSI